MTKLTGVIVCSACSLLAPHAWETSRAAEEFRVRGDDTPFVDPLHDTASEQVRTEDAETHAGAY